jgi:hypothetical protein
MREDPVAETAADLIAKAAMPATQDDAVAMKSRWRPSAWQCTNERYPLVNGVVTIVM